MEILGGSKEKGTVYVAVLTLAAIGAVLVLSTWQILQRQWETSMEHLELTAASVLQAVDSSLRRGPMMGRNRTSPEAREFFRDLERSGDLLFVGLLDENGKRLTAEGESNPPFALPEDALQALRSGNRWQGVARYGENPIYVAARRIQGGAPVSALPGNPPGGGRRHGRHYQDHVAPQPPPGPGLFLMVAVDMEKHFAAYEGFKKTAVFQTAYILAAAVFLWVLAIRFISRRSLARKAVILERFQAKLIDNLPDGLILADAAGRVLAANPAARDILSAPGRSLPLAGGNLNDLIAPFAPGIDPTVDKGWQQTVLGAKLLEIRVLPFQSDTPATGGGEPGSPSRMVIVRDRTHIRTLEQNLAEAEKLAAIGSLAAGVAHEIRNPLSALRGFAQYFARKLAGKQPEEEYAQTMVRESDRMNRVITDLLYLARPRDLAPVRADLTAVCDEMRTLLHFELREQELSLVCSLEAASVTADPDALKQALLNLLLNSLQALGNRSAATDRSIVVSARSGTEKGLPGVWVLVTDTGPGMTEEELTQARKPFFTTKKKGTGLGLALVQAIMQSHGGNMVITSPFPPESNHGCAVGLFFPDGPEP